MLEKLTQEIKAGREDEGACQTCQGSGKIANDDDQTPWQYWQALPYASRVAERMGIVKPIPCPTCNGTGREK